jgi:hypothetical protein
MGAYRIMVMGKKGNNRPCDFGHRKGAYIEVRKKVTSSTAE